jgi:hypothetical protein
MSEQQPSPEHQRPGGDLPQRHPVPAGRPHPEPAPLPRRAPGGSL